MFIHNQYSHKNVREKFYFIYFHLDIKVNFRSFIKKNKKTFYKYLKYIVLKIWISFHINKTETIER